MDKIVGFLEEDRLERKLSHNKYAKLIGIDPGKWSRVRRGLDEPTSDFKLTVYTNLKDKQIQLLPYLPKDVVEAIKE